MKKDVTFPSAGMNLAGHLYLPEGSMAGPRPAIVVGHPGSGVKEQAAGLYAERLARAGFVTLAFDAAYQGESEGTPRGLEDPAQRIEDFKAAVSFLGTLDGVDPERIGALGVCASGGYVVSAAATDLRIKAVATVSGVDVGRMFREGPDGKQDPAVLQGLLAAAAAARSAEARGEGMGSFPIFPDTEEQARAAGAYAFEGWEYYCTDRGQHPRSARRFTWNSADRIAAFDAFRFIDRIAPRPLLVIAGRRAATAHQAIDAFEHAQQPKELFWIDGASHVDLYDRDPHVETAVVKLADFFGRHLQSRE
ncbi:MAG: alpha/beta hydrolase [Minicystis sp.]